MQSSHIGAVLEALHCRNGSAQRLSGLIDTDLLQWCDGRQVTLLLHHLHGNSFPATIQRRMARCREAGELRFATLKKQLFEITEALDEAGIEFVLLKGLTHAPALTPDPIVRAQGDIDLWFHPGDVHRAREILPTLGYVSRPERRTERRHLAPMVRPHDWKWRGDLFDPAMPIHVELHHQLWCDEGEHIALPGVDDFRARSIVRSFDGHAMRVLRDEDLLGFAAMHFLLHLLHGDLPLQRAWEIARFLHERAGDDAFWTSWRYLHSPELRHIEALVFQIVSIWFQCDLAPCVQRESAGLPPPVHLWLRHWSLSPLERHTRPNKDELWLHLALAPSRAARARVFLRRLIPNEVPKSGRRSPRLRHHASTLLPTLAGALRWLWLNRGKFAPSPRPAIDPHSSALPMRHARFE